MAIQGHSPLPPVAPHFPGPQGPLVDSVLIVNKPRQSKGSFGKFYRDEVL